jgi:hypothetical protein
MSIRCEYMRMNEKRVTQRKANFHDRAAHPMIFQVFQRLLHCPASDLISTDNLIDASNDQKAEVQTLTRVRKVAMDYIRSQYHPTLLICRMIRL